MICDTILDWDMWAPFLAYCHVTGGTRLRIEIAPVPVTERMLRRQALMLQVPCPACRVLHHPIREREDGSWYFATSCHTEDNYRCSRSRRTHQELGRVAGAVRGDEPGPVFVQISLF